MAVDDGTQMLRSPFLHEVRFRMEMIKLMGDYNQVFLSCAAFVCPINDNSARCNNPAANYQHMPNANRLVFRKAEETIAQTIREMSSFHKIFQHNLKRQPNYYSEDFPQFVSHKEVSIGTN